MKSGLYALASLDGAPLDPADCGTLGLASPSGEGAQGREGLALRAIDPDAAAGAVDLVVRRDRVVAFAGFLDEPAGLARLVGLAAAASPAELALAALDRFGDDAPAKMLGEWSLVAWRAPERELTLLASEACRDPIYFATDGRRIAVSPELRRLSKLGWVGNAFDSEGFLLQVSRARLRRVMTGETVLRGARRVVPGTREVFSEGGRRSGTVCAPDTPDAWQGGFEDGVAALEKVLRRIVRQQLERHRTVASLLSGGLDSSLVAWLASEERGAGQTVFFLTSVAPEGSGLPDEREYSRIVAERLGLPISFLCPPETASAYTPTARMFARAELAVVSPRHYLYDALYDAGLARGADALLDGAYGELTITNKSSFEVARTSLRQAVRDARERLRAWRESRAWPADGFHVRLSRGALAALPPGWAGEWREDWAPDPAPRAGEPWGFRAAIRKNAMTPTGAEGMRLRHLMPYRDRRLLRLAASMPADFMRHGGTNRALGRALLKDRLPDTIRLRQSGAPFSPDFNRRLRTQAPLALERMAQFRAAGADEWLDLEWLAGALSRLAKGAAVSGDEASVTQMTAIAAEFFVWWRDGARD